MSNVYQSFKNPEVILTAYDDKRLATFNTNPCWFEQDEHGPTYIVIRPLASDYQLNRLADRFKLKIADLKSFRNFKAK